MGLLTENKEIGNIEINRLMENRRIITNRWEKIGFLEGLSGHKKENIAQLFENQLKYMKKKTRVDEASQSVSSGSFETVAFPVIRRVFSKLLANDIVSVQALNLPVGKLFYMNPKISKRYEDTDFAQEQRHYHPDNAYANSARTRGLFGETGGTDDQTLVQYADKSLYDSWYATLYDDYGDSLFDRSRGRLKPVTGTTTIVSGVIGTDKYIKVRITGFSTDNQGKLIGGSGTSIDTESFLSSLKLFPNGTLTADAGYESFNKTAFDTVPFNVSVQKYGASIVNSAGEIELDVDLTYPGIDYVAYTATGVGAATNFTYIYNEYSDLEQDSEMAEVTFQLDEVTVATTTRKMRAQWTPELAMDVQQFHNIDAEAELTALLSETMAAEIDREILRDLRSVAAWTTRFDYNGLKKVSGNFYGTQKDWNQLFVTKIYQVSAQIMKATLRGGANWIVVSPEISAMLNDLEYFHVSDASPESNQYNMGIEKIGTIRGSLTVYRDPYAPANLCLVGRKGSSILETGYIYAPYVPMELTPVMYDPRDFSPIRGIITRFGKKVVNNRFIARVLVDGLQTFGVGELR